MPENSKNTLDYESHCERNPVINAIQITYVLENHNKQREIDGLIAAMEKFQLRNGLILTKDQEDNIKQGDLKIKIIPAWKWLLKIS